MLLKTRATRPRIVVAGTPRGPCSVRLRGQRYIFRLGNEPTHEDRQHADQRAAQRRGRLFASDRIPHHAQTVEMADMALNTASDPEVKALAAAIKNAQAPKITPMTGWLRGWGSAAPDMQMQHSMGGTGMMSSDEMTALGKASGASFDRMWVDMMTRHHQGAVTMARAELPAGQNTDAKALAERIISTQTRELDRMKVIANRLAG